MLNPPPAAGDGNGGSRRRARRGHVRKLPAGIFRRGRAVIDRQRVNRACRYPTTSPMGRRVLGHRVALADRDGAVGERVEVHRGRSTACPTRPGGAVPATDGLRHIEVDHPVGRQRGEDGPGLARSGPPSWRGATRPPGRAPTDDAAAARPGSPPAPPQCRRPPAGMPSWPGSRRRPARSRTARSARRRAWS